MAKHRDRPFFKESTTSSLSTRPKILVPSAESRNAIQTKMPTAPLALTPEVTYCLNTKHPYTKQISKEPNA